MSIESCAGITPPSVLRECRYEASELPVPFICPLTHLFDIVRFQSIRDRPEAHGRIACGRERADVLPRLLHQPEAVFRTS